tara:strand:- start:13 stop:390 length:378 start_codon:yes stop_codon:yes gene_type:complete
MSFNTAYILTTKFGSTDLLEGKDQITLDFDSAGISIPSIYATSELSEDRPLYKFVWREQFGFHLEPMDQPEGMAGPFGNGVYAEVNRLVRKKLAESKNIDINQIPELMRVHERFKTWDEYEALSK